MAKVFISYSRRNKLQAEKLTEALAQSNLETWIDWEDIPPTADWMDQIHKGIEEADAFLFLLSPDSVMSKVCGQEIEHAVQNGKRLIPIVICDVDPNNVHPALAKVNWIYGREKDNFDEMIGKTLLAIQTDLSWVETHKRLQVRAIEWNKRKDNSLLLRGKYLREAEEKLASSGQKDPQPTDLQRLYLLASRRGESRARNLLLVLGAVVIAALALLSVFAINQRNVAADNAATAVFNQNAAQTAESNAQQQTKIAQQQSRFSFARQLASQASSFRTADYQFALLLAIEAVKTTYIPDGIATLEAETILRGLLSGSYRAVILKDNVDVEIDRVIFSPNEKYLLALDKKSTVYLWNTITGEQKQEFQNPEELITDVQFTPDSEQLAYSNAAGDVIIQSIEKGTNRILVQSGTEIRRLAFRPKTSQLVTSSADGIIRIWDWQKGALVKSVDLKALVRNLWFSPDGADLLIFAADGSVQMWHLDGDAPMFVLEPPKSAVSNVIVDSNWKRTLIDKGDGILVEWDNLDRSIRRTISRANTFQVFYTGSNLRIINSQANGLTSLWDGESDRRLATLTDREVLGMQPYMLKSNEVGNILLVAREDNRADIWDLANGGRINTISGFKGKISLAEISKSGRFIATVHTDKKIRLWNAVSEPDRTSLPGLSQGAWRIVFDKSGKYVAAAGQDGIAIVWDVLSGEIVSRMIGHEVGVDGSAGINNLSFNPTGDKLATAGWDKTVRIWDALSGKNLFVLPHQETLTDVNFSPTGDFIASADLSGIYLWNVAEGKLVTKWGTPKVINRLAFSVDGRYLAAVGDANSSGVWDVYTKQKVTDLPTASSMTYVQFSPNGEQLASVGFDGKAYIWDTKTWHTSSVLPGMKDSMWSLAYSPDGAKIVTGGDEGKIRIWNSRTGELLRSFQGHSSRIWSISYHPQGTAIATGGEDGTIRIWDVTSGLALTILPDVVGAKSLFNFNVGEHNLDKTVALESGTIDISSNEKGVTWLAADKPLVLPWVMAVAFSPDGTKIASANMDGTVDIYVSDVSTLLALAQSRVERELTCQERVQFLYENLICEVTPTPMP